MPEIDAEIDLSSRSVVHRATENVLATTVVEYQELTENQRSAISTWRFDWASESAHATRELAILLVHGSATPQGMISLEPAPDHVVVHLLENAPHNVGQNKVYRGVAGNLMAYACARSFRLGSDGYVGFIAKTELIEHYARTLGATQVGTSNRMIIDTQNATHLVDQYFTEQDKWPS